MSRPRDPAIRERILGLRAEDPRITGTEIAKVLGVSRQRAFQLLNEMGLPTRTTTSESERFAAFETAGERWLAARNALAEHQTRQNIREERAAADELEAALRAIIAD